MSKSKYHLTNREEELMEMLWQSNKPLTSVEMLERSDGSSWKDNYLHIMLRSLLKKGSIQVCGTVQYGTQYARQFEPALTKEEYAAKLIAGKGLVDGSIAKVTAALAKETKVKDTDKLIKDLEEFIDTLKEN